MTNDLSAKHGYSISISRIQLCWPALTPGHARQYKYAKGTNTRRLTLRFRTFQLATSFQQLDQLSAVAMTTAN